MKYSTLAAMVVGASLAFMAGAEERKTEIDVSKMERAPIPIFNLALDGQVSVDSLMFPVLPEPYVPYMCIREFDADTIRCYIVNTETRAASTTDLKVPRK